MAGRIDPAAQSPRREFRCPPTALGLSRWNWVMAMPRESGGRVSLPSPPAGAEQAGSPFSVTGWKPILPPHRGVSRFPPPKHSFVQHSFVTLPLCLPLRALRLRVSFHSLLAGSNRLEACFPSSPAPGPVFRGAAAQGPAEHAVEKGNVGKPAIEGDLDDAPRRIREFVTGGLEPEFD